MAKIEAQDLIDAIEDAGFEAQSYSGRCMFGAECVSVTIDGISDLWRLAGDLVQQGHDVPAPTTDSMGMGIVAYWPSVKWPS